MRSRTPQAPVLLRALPGWFDDAKLGVFVHWGPYSVPGWAPPVGDMPQVTATRGWSYWFANNPYAEWYANSMAIPGSPTWDYHRRTYGDHFPYSAFGPMFDDASRRWDPEGWADLFVQTGARYVVLTAKHHDGYLLWPSSYPNPRQPFWQAGRDLVGELSRAVRARGIPMGLYYSGGPDWTFGGIPIRDIVDLLLAIPQDPHYAAYVDQHWRELIDRYQPSVLWNDIGSPAAVDLDRLFRDYYAAVPDGVVNDRFSRVDLGPAGSLRRRVTVRMLRLLLPWLIRLTGGAQPPVNRAHCDFTTPEYRSGRPLAPQKWEMCRGLGYSFGYNRAETDEQLITVEALVRTFVDVVSKNGNLLLDIGPMADGTIPEIQRRRLLGLGAWLRVHGEAIFGSRPWVRAEGETADRIPVRFTRRGEALYAFLLGSPMADRVVLRGLRPSSGATVTLLGRPDSLPWSQEGPDLAITLPDRLPDAPAHALRIVPAPMP